MTHPSLQEIREAAQAAQDVLDAGEYGWYDNEEVAEFLENIALDEDSVQADVRFISLISPMVVLKMLDLINELGKKSYLENRRNTNPLLGDLMECKGGDAVYAEDPSSDHYHYIENTAEAMREALDA